MIVFDGIESPQWPQLSKFVGDLLESEGVNASEESDYDPLTFRDRFPLGVWVEDRERCARVPWAIWAYARDGFEHRLVTPLHRHFLYWTLVEAGVSLRAEYEQATDPASRQGRQQDLDTTEELLAAMGRPDFVGLEPLVNDLLAGRNPEITDQVDFTSLLEVMPSDIRVRVQQKVQEGGSKEPAH